MVIDPSEELSLERIEQLISEYDRASAQIAILQGQVTDLTDEVAQIKQDAESYALETSATKTGVGAVKKDFLSKHARYNTAVSELRRASNDLAVAQCTQESSRMRAWARIAILQNRAIAPEEAHTHPISDI